MARRVPDREENRDVAFACAAEGFIAPGEPVDRIVRVLAQIWARRARQAVRPLRHVPQSPRFRMPTPPADAVYRDGYQRSSLGDGAGCRADPRLDACLSTRGGVGPRPRAG